MLMVNQLIGFGAGDLAVPTLTLLGTQTDSTTTNAFTFSTFNAGGNSLGAETSAKHIAIVTGMRSSVGNTLSSLTVGGSAATVLDQGINGTGCASAVAIISTSGTTGDIVVTWNGNVAMCFVAAYKLLNLSSAVAVATAKSGLQTASLSLNTSADGIVIAGGFCNAATSATPTGITEDLDAQIGGLRTAYAGSASGVVAATPRTVTIAWAAAGDSHCTAASLR